uniref:helix-turn-helix domain-containing protein n=1 Tax=Gordonia sp. B7-2 TaxID=3420932 RepID=UPI003D8BF65B
MPNEESIYVPVAKLQNLIGCTRAAAIRLIDSGEVSGRKLGGRYYVRRDALDELSAN